METAWNMFATATGEVRFVCVPSPNWPAKFPPQHSTVPSSNSAQAWNVPAARRIRWARTPFSPLNRLVANATVVITTIAAMKRIVLPS
jgi:hypothetical protein